MKRQIVLGFATLFVLAGVFSATSGPAKQVTQNQAMSAAPMPSCDPSTHCDFPF